MISIAHSCQFCEVELTTEPEVIITPEQITEIIENTAEKHGFSVEHILSRCRRQPVALARQEVMYQLYIIGLTLTEVGRVLHRSPATISYGFQKIATTKEIKDA